MLSQQNATDEFRQRRPRLSLQGSPAKSRALNNQGWKLFNDLFPRTLECFARRLTGAISHALATKGMRRSMPSPLPILVLRRLAVGRRYHKQGLGKALLRDTMLRSVNVSGDAGVFALLVHALSEPAKQFYLSLGFINSPIQPMALLMTLETIRIILAEPE